MIRRWCIILLVLCLTAVTIEAQRVTHRFENVSMSDALRYLQSQSSQYHIVFIFNDLEDFSVTASVKNQTIPEAIRQLINFYPISMTIKGGREIYVECTHKTDYRVIGRLVNEMNEPMEYANIAILNPADSSYITGGVSNASGMFVIPVEQSQVIARISFVGYKTLYKHCRASKLGTLRMEPYITPLDEMQVSAPRASIQRNGTDLILSDLDGTMIGNAGTALEMLRWAPGILVDAEGHIKTVGRNSTLLYVNSRLINDTQQLTSLNSQDVKRIEVIRDPDAQYASSADAVIKIYTHSPLKNFLGASVTDVIDFKRKVSNATTLNIDGKYNKWSGNISLGYNRAHPRGNNSQNAYGNNGWKMNTTHYDGKTDDYRVFAGINYAMTPKSVFGLQYNGNFITSGIDMQGLWSFYRQSWFSIDTVYISLSDMKLKSVNNSFSASYLWQPSDDSQLLLIADYATSYQTNSQSILEQGALEPKAIDYYNDYDIITATARYDFATHGWQHKSGLEWGNANNYSQVSKNDDIQRCSRDNKWLAAYYILERQWSHWRANIGLRYEFDHTRTEQDVVIRYNKNYHDLLPSLSIGYRIHPDLDLSVRYRRTLARPTYNQLRSTFYYNVLPQSSLGYSTTPSGTGFMLFDNAPQATSPGNGLSPNVIYMNAEDIATGNPELRPTVTDRIALTAQYHHFTATLSYRSVNNAIESIYQLFTSGTLCQSPVNIPHFHTWTVDLDYTYNSDRLNLYLLASNTWPHNHGDNYRPITMLHGNVQYKVLPHLTVGSSLMYSSPWKIGYTWHNSTLCWNLGVRASLCRDRLLLGADFNDVFNRGMSTRRDTRYMMMTHYLEVQNDLRSISLMVRWTFNTISNPFKRRNGNDTPLQRTQETIN